MARKDFEEYSPALEIIDCADCAQYRQEIADLKEEVQRAYEEGVEAGRQAGFLEAENLFREEI